MKEKILTFIINEEKKLLLLKGSSNDPQLHKSIWYVVTGSKEHIDNNLFDTVKREVKEETNLEVKEIIDIDWYFEYDSLGEKCIEHAYISKVENRIIKLNEESIEYKWLDINDFINQIDWYYDKRDLEKKLKQYISG